MVPFQKSVGNYHYIGVCKILDADSPNPMPTLLQRTFYDSSFSPSGTTSMLGPGEDPRVFIFKQTAFAQTWSPGSGNMDHWVVNLQSGERHSLNDCPVPGGGFRGKNWVPLVVSDTYYFATRVHPTLVLNEYNFLSKQCRIAEFPEFQVFFNGNQIDDDYDIETITEFRGGSAFVQISSTLYIAIGHQTVSLSIHRPYFMLLDLQKNTYHISTISSFDTSKGILDPTSLWLSNGKLFMGGVKTKGVWHPLYYHFDKSPCSDCHFENSVYVVENISKIDNSFTQRMLMIPESIIEI